MGMPFGMPYGSYCAATRTVGAEAAAARATTGDAVINETLSSSGKITSRFTLSSDEALAAGEKFLGGPGSYREFGRAGSGVFRNEATGFQFRMDNGSLTGTHAPGVPHVHFEIYRPGAPKPYVNNHVPFFDF
jgi:filamentous hemagglutinin